jgi:hypothetical protein
MTSGRKGWTKHVARTGQKRTVNMVLAPYREETTYIDVGGNSKMEFKEIRWEYVD